MRTKAEQGDFLMNMAAFSMREVLYHQAEGDKKGLKYWQKMQTYYMDAFAEYLQELGPGEPDLNECYMDALEFVYEADRWLPNV